MTSTATLYCPVCDPRAIGLPGDHEDDRVTVSRLLDVQADQIAQCSCGARFNTGTTRAYGGRMQPLSLRGLRSLVEDKFCQCGPDVPTGALDVNYVDAQGVEQRVHGFVHTGPRSCFGWAQVG